MTAEEKMKAIAEATRDVELLEAAIESRRQLLVKQLGEDEARRELLVLDRRSLGKALNRALFSLSAMAADHPRRGLLALQVNAMETYDNALGYRINAEAQHG